MNLNMALMATTHLLSFAMALQTFEMLLMIRNKEFYKVWSFENLKEQIESGLPLPNFLISNLFSITGFKNILIIQLILSFVGFLFPAPAIFIGLFLTHLLINVRFRGTVNGGSDMMTFVVLTGVLISFINGAEKLGLIYICIHALYSYFKAGFVKLIHNDWKSGFALPSFLGRSLFSDIVLLSKKLQPNLSLNKVLGWSVLLFELSVILLPFFHFLTIPYFICAFIFHFLIYISFGLNRFFWIWMAAWPAVIFSFT